ncbi:MAG: NADH-quinone oxidoreductase subunit N [Chloroflexi bacterium]|nr:NADH-quinone oxidoreductase subunit N [Chloroflexota bacterium]
MELYLIFPELVLLLCALLVIFSDLLGARKEALAGLAVLGLLIAARLAMELVGPDKGGVAFAGAIVVDDFALIFKFLFLVSTLLVVLASVEYVERFEGVAGEYYAVLLLACVGMMLMASAQEFITLYLSLELTGISLYTLTGLLRDARSSEAGIKFLLLGAVSSAVLLYGIAVLFGLTGTTSLPQMAPAVASGFQENRLPLLLATALLMAGLGFKLATVPFQMWVPDVYEGAPTPVTAFLSVASKSAGFVVVLRVFHTALGRDPLAADWAAIFAGLSLASMTLGNVVAIQQGNIKRMMGYSSIAQAGYLLVGLAVVPQSGVSGVLFFLVSYTVTNLGAFIAIIALSDKLNSDRISDYAGVWQRAPFLASGLALCLLSLTGVPPTAGFFAKLFIFNVAVQQNLLWLVVAGVLNSVVSAYFYVGVIREMFLGAPVDRTPVAVAAPVALALFLAVAGTFILGVFPGPAMSVASAAAGSLVP